MDDLRLVAASRSQMIQLGSNKFMLHSTAPPRNEDVVVDMNWESGGIQWDGFNCVVAKVGRKPAAPPPRRLGDRCQVAGCRNSLDDLKKYYRRHKICAHHMSLDSMELEGVPQRFCQQCGRFQPLHLFDGKRRTCRTRLLSHNQRRREMRAAARGTDDPAAAPPPARRRRADGPAKLLSPPARPDDGAPPSPDTSGAPSPGAAAGADDDDGQMSPSSSSASSGTGSHDAAHAPSPAAPAAAAAAAVQPPGSRWATSGQLLGSSQPLGSSQLPAVVSDRPHLVTARSATGATHSQLPSGPYPPLLSLVRAANSLHPTPAVAPQPPCASLPQQQQQQQQQQPPRQQHAVIKPIPHRIARPLPLHVHRPPLPVGAPLSGAFASHTPLPSPFLLTASGATAAPPGSYPSTNSTASNFPAGSLTSARADGAPGAGLLGFHRSLTSPLLTGTHNPQGDDPLPPFIRKLDSAPAAPGGHQSHSLFRPNLAPIRPTPRHPEPPPSAPSRYLVAPSGALFPLPSAPPSSHSAVTYVAPASDAPASAPALPALRSSAPRLRLPSDYRQPRPSSPLAAFCTPHQPSSATATSSLPTTPLAALPGLPSTTTADSYAASPPPPSSTHRPSPSRPSASPSTDHPPSPTTATDPPDAPLTYEALELLISFSLKIFNTLPSRLPPNLRAHLHTLASDASDALHLEAAIRPGCIHLAVDAFCPVPRPPAAPRVPSAAELAARLLPLDAFWGAARLEVQSGGSRCRLDRGEIQDMCLGSPMADCDGAVSPLCIHDPGRQPLTLTVPGSPACVSAAGPRAFFRCAGQYLNPEGDAPGVLPGPTPDTALLSFHLPPPSRGGHLVRLELTAADGQQLLPSPLKVVLVVDTPEMALEVCALQRPDLRHLAATVLPDLGRVLEAAAVLCPTPTAPPAAAPTAPPAPAPAVATRSYTTRERQALLDAARQLLRLSAQLQWRHVPATLLPIVAALANPAPAPPPHTSAALPAGSKAEPQLLGRPATPNPQDAVSTLSSPATSAAGPTQGAGSAQGAGPTQGAGSAQGAGPTQGAGSAQGIGPTQSAGPAQDAGRQADAPPAQACPPPPAVASRSNSPHSSTVACGAFADGASYADDRGYTYGPSDGARRPHRELGAAPVPTSPQRSAPILRMRGGGSRRPPVRALTAVLPAQPPAGPARPLSAPGRESVRVQQHAPARVAPAAVTAAAPMPSVVLPRVKVGGGCSVQAVRRLWPQGVAAQRGVPWLALPAGSPAC